MYISKEYQQSAGTRDWKINATDYEKDSSKEEYNNSVYKYLSSFKNKYENKLAIQDDVLIYIGSDKKEKGWLEGTGVKIAKSISVRYLDGDEEELLPSEERVQYGSEGIVSAKPIDGYMPYQEKLTWDSSENDSITFVYYPICNDLEFIGYNQSGTATEESSEISYYNVKGLGSCKQAYVAIPREHNGKPVKNIVSNGFSGNTGTLKGVIIADNIENIYGNAFISNSSVRNISINAKVINNGAFAYCGINKVYLGLNVETIKNDCFCGSSVTEYIIDGENVSYISYLATLGKAQNVFVPSYNSSYVSINGILYSKDKKKLLLYPAARTGEFVIPDFVEEIGPCAFCSSKSTVSNFKNVKKIGYSAFSVSAQQEIELSDQVEVIDINLFVDNSNIKKVTLNAKEMKQGAFARCRNLEEMNLGNNLRKIGVWVFSDCPKLKEINFKGTIQEWNSVEKNSGWKTGNTQINKIVCTDGEINL